MSEASTAPVVGAALAEPAPTDPPAPNPSPADFSLVDPALTEGPARSRVLEMIAAAAPVTAAELARQLGVTPAAVRRHVAALECDGLVAVHDAGHVRARGRPARHYVTTPRGQAELAGGYSDIAVQALRFLRAEAGEEAIERFARSRSAEVRDRYARRVGADDVASRAAQLAQVLTAEGYAATVRPVRGTRAIQLCQGHCPVQHVAREFPALCDAEARAFSELLGSHVQRLATLAAGGHACTTNIPLTIPGGAPAATSEPPAPSTSDHPLRTTKDVI